jgi:hypothetical protein
MFGAKTAPPEAPEQPVAPAQGKAWRAPWKLFDRFGQAGGRIVPGVGVLPQHDQSGVGLVAVYASIAGGGTKQVVDGIRVLKKYREVIPDAKALPLVPQSRVGAHRAVNTLKTHDGRMWLKQVLTSSPDTRILDPSRAGRFSFSKLDEHAYRASTLFGGGLAVLQLGSAFPNLVHAYREDGASGFHGSREGRSGVMQFAGGGLVVGLLGNALLNDPKAVAARSHGALHHRIANSLVAAGGSPSVTRPRWVNLGVGIGAAVILNQLGYFDSLNLRETRSFGETVGDAVDNTVGAVTAVYDAGAALVSYVGHTAQGVLELAVPRPTVR